jgi:DNA-binding HxlR family transcriptional regulator
MENVELSLCPKAEALLSLIAKKWNGFILLSLREGERCFNELARSVPGLSSRLLSVRIKELEAAGLVARKVHGDAPLRVRYELTDKGVHLAGLLGEIASWASGQREAPGRKRPS